MYIPDFIAGFAKLHPSIDSKTTIMDLEMTTELVWFTLASDVDLASGDAKRIWDKTLEIISEQPGQISIHWGFQVEDPRVLKMAVGKYRDCTPNSSQSETNRLTCHRMGIP